MENIMEFAAFEEIKDGSRNRTAGYTIAWVIGVALVLLIIAAIWNRSHAGMMARNGESCVISNRLGLLEGQMASVGKVLDQVVPALNETGRAVAAVTVGLDGYVKCTDKEFGHVYSGLNKLDNAVFVPRFAHGYEGCGRGRAGGRPEFEQRATYVQNGNPEVIMRAGCGSEFN